MRNGSIHVGSEGDSTKIITLVLAIIEALLDDLGVASDHFYAEWTGTAEILLDNRTTDIQKRVAAALDKATRRFDRYWDEHGNDLAVKLTDQFEAAAPTNINANDFGDGLYAIDHRGPVCSRSGRLLGDLDLDFVYDTEGGPEPYEYVTPSLEFYPQAYACNVCKLRLRGKDELDEADVQPG